MTSVALIYLERAMSTLLWTLEFLKGAEGAVMMLSRCVVARACIMRPWVFVRVSQRVCRALRSPMMTEEPLAILMSCALRVS